MRYGLANYQKRDLSDEVVSEDWLSDIPVENAKTNHLYETAATDVYIEDEMTAPLLLMKEGEEIEVKCQVRKNLEAPVKKGQEVGKIEYLLNGDVLWERKICIGKTIQKEDLFWFFEMVLANFLF